jgi:hypothetical protein
MGTIENQIEALTQELRPYPTGQEWYSFNPSLDPREVSGVFTHTLHLQKHVPQTNELLWLVADKASTNKSEVEDYADCYRRLKLYQLLGEKADKMMLGVRKKYATDFGAYQDDELAKKHSGQIMVWPNENKCCLGGVRFSMEEDRLKALEICGIDKAFQERCAKFGLGGA